MVAPGGSEEGRQVRMEQIKDLGPDINPVDRDHASGRGPT